MKPAPFEYHAPETVDEATALLAEHGNDARILAGGQSLVPTMNFRLAQPAVLIDLNRVGELVYIEALGDGESRTLEIGAMTRQATAERSALVSRQLPMMAAALPYIAHPQIRNRGTVGGSIAHADPAAELPALAVALGADIVIRNRQGERSVSAADFFQGLFTTSLEPEEVLAAVRFPCMDAATGWSFQEIARRHGDYALVGVAATLSFTDEVCDAAKLVFLSVGGGPVQATGAEEIIVGSSVDGDVVTEAARCAAYDDILPGDDIHASADYRRHLAAVLARRALAEARGRAAGAPR